MSPPTRDELLNAILHRSVSDSAFRQALLENPNAAIRDAFGVHVPAGYRLKFIEKDRGIDALIVLPDLRTGDENSNDELSEDELEIVAGGASDTYHWAPPPSPGGLG